jgi:hypothetical protein
MALLAEGCAEIMRGRLRGRWGVPRQIIPVRTELEKVPVFASCSYPPTRRRGSSHVFVRRPGKSWNAFSRMMFTA